VILYSVQCYALHWTDKNLSCFQLWLQVTVCRSLRVCGRCRDDHDQNAGLQSRHLESIPKWRRPKPGIWNFRFNYKNKKLQLMLTRRAKTYSSSCAQTGSPSPAISLQSILGVCAAAEDHKKSIKPLILEVQGLSKSSMLIRMKSL